VRTGLEQNDEDRGIWISNDGGLPPIQIAGVAETLWQPRVRIYVRTGPRAHDELEALIASVVDAVNRTAPSGYAVSNPQPIIEGRTDQYGRPWASFRLQLTIQS
jgi:hypothetical protein